MLEEHIIASSEAGQRLDIFVVTHLHGLSRATLQRAIKTGSILVNGQMAKPRYLVKEGDVVTMQVKNPETPTPTSGELPELPILYEDKDVVVINKPAGLVVHAGVGTPSGGTIVDWLRARYPEMGTVGEDASRSGVVHRLDKDTSGVLVLAKTQSGYDHLKAQWHKRAAKKTYFALVYGVPGERRGRINRPLARSPRNPLRRTVMDRPSRAYGRNTSAKDAITEWQQEETFKNIYTLLTVWPETGRTHQIRAHLHWLGFPIVGDNLYTFKRQRPPQGVKRQLLHAAELTLILPSKDKKTFVAPLPEDFAQVLENLRA